MERFALSRLPRRDWGIEGGGKSGREEILIYLFLRYATLLFRTSTLVLAMPPRSNRKKSERCFGRDVAAEKSTPSFFLTPYFCARMPSNDSKSPLADRHILISAGGGNTAQAIIELLLADGFASKYKELSVVVMEDEVDTFQEQFDGVGVLVYKTDEVLDLGNIDTMMLIPPSSDVSTLPLTPRSPFREVGSESDVTFSRC